MGRKKVKKKPRRRISVVVREIIGRRRGIEDFLGVPREIPPGAVLLEFMATGVPIMHVP